ncbi:MAG: beta-ketoacyl synthase N-terminal-like domain-containing protein, partial [Proteobacteria bacterium]|nr:beta-ketoacyl synthase N-terminal-like domain-containing protein [Pseudomonadota bacterium]
MIPKLGLYISATELLSPAGWGLAAHLESLRAERCHLKSYNDIYEGRLPDSIQELLSLMAQEKGLRHQDPLIRLAVMATRSLSEKCRIRANYGVIMGSSRGSSSLIESNLVNFNLGQRLLPSVSPTTTAGALPASIAREANLQGPSLFVSAACATGMHAIIQACATIRMGLAPGMLAGGAEYSNTPFTLAMLRAAKIYSEEAQEGFPCRPTGVDRQGMVLGEGAALLLLETDPIYQPMGEVLGWGASTEQSSLTGISVEGNGLERAIKQALTI